MPGGFHVLIVSRNFECLAEPHAHELELPRKLAESFEPAYGRTAPGPLDEIVGPGCEERRSKLPGNLGITEQQASG
jgi:hypothetical protein